MKEERLNRLRKMYLELPDEDKPAVMEALKELERQGVIEEISELLRPEN